MGGRRRLFSAASGVVVIVAVLSGCTGARPHFAAARIETTTTTTTEPTTSTSTPPAAPDTTWVAQAQVPEVAVYDAPGAATPVQTLANPSENEVPLVFLVAGPNTDEPWVHVYLPAEPNGGSGWIRRDDVVIVSTTYRVTVELGARQLTVTKEGRVELQAPIGIGTAETPSPGVYFIKELLQLPDPDGPYGSYAYGLSGFTNNVTLLSTGEGLTGIHGTSDPSSLDEDTSPGSLRVANDVIDQMAGILPLGTPVEILP